MHYPDDENELSRMQTDKDVMFRNHLRVNWDVCNKFLGKETEIGHWQVIFKLSFLSVGFLSEEKPHPRYQKWAKHFCHYLDLDSANYLLLLLCLVVLIIAIHSCLVSGTLTSPKFTFGIDWMALWQSHLHLFPLFHCCIPYFGYQYDLEYCSR